MPVISIVSIILAVIGAVLASASIIKGVVQMTIAILSCSHRGDVAKNKAKFKAYVKNAYVSVAVGIVIALVFAGIIVLINLKYL